MRHFLFVAFVLILAALAVGCRPTPTPLPTFTPIPPPTARIVTLSPATITPQPTTTLAYNPERVAGRWLLDFHFEFTDGILIDQTDYYLSAGIDVDDGGRISGRGEFATMASHPGCDARLTGGGNFWAQLSGQVVEQGNELFFDVALTPEDRMVQQSFLMYCPDYSVEYQSQLLLYAMRESYLDTFRIPAEYGARIEIADKITSVTADELNWQMLVTVTVGR